VAARRLNVVQVLPALDAGGVERGTLEVADHLAGAGHRSTVISAGGRLVDALERGGSRHLTIPIGRKRPTTLLLAASLRRALIRIRPDIVHARSRLPAWVARLALGTLGAASRPRFVTTVHGFYSVNAYSAIMTRGERVIAVSESIRRYILDNYPRTAPERIAVIHRGIDAAEFPHGYRPPAAWLETWYGAFPSLRGKYVIAIAGRLARLKGHHEFLSIIERMMRDHPDVHGLIAGAAGPRERYAAELRRRAERLRLPVSFAGHRDDMREVYASCNLVLSLSTQPESFGRTVLEPLSLGVPVIGYDHGGVGEILGRMFAQGRVPVRDQSAVVQRIEAFMHEPPVPEARVAYPLSRMLEDTVHLYEEIARC